MSFYTTAVVKPEGFENLANASDALKLIHRYIKRFCVDKDIENVQDVLMKLGSDETLDIDHILKSNSWISKAVLFYFEDLKDTDNFDLNALINDRENVYVEYVVIVNAMRIAMRPMLANLTEQDKAFEVASRRTFVESKKRPLVNQNELHLTCIVDMLSRMKMWLQPRSHGENVPSFGASASTARSSGQTTGDGGGITSPDVSGKTSHSMDPASSTTGNSDQKTKQEEAITIDDDIVNTTPNTADTRRTDLDGKQKANASSAGEAKHESVKVDLVDPLEPAKRKIDANIGSSSGRHDKRKRDDKPGPIYDLWQEFIALYNRTDDVNCHTVEEWQTLHAKFSSIQTLFGWDKDTGSADSQKFNEIHDRMFCFCCFLQNIANDDPQFFSDVEKVNGVLQGTELLSLLPSEKTMQDFERELYGFQEAITKKKKI
jgi:hypothetical protein